VRLTIEGHDSRVIPDLSAGADVVLERAENKPVVPLGAIQTENGKTVVYVKNGESFEKREVQIAMKNETHAAIESGIRTGEEVRLN
jgi:cobalt-zinc-cadmium efflux system membrane fusion protein